MPGSNYNHVTRSPSMRDWTSYDTGAANFDLLSALWSRNLDHVVVGVLARLDPASARACASVCADWARMAAAATTRGRRRRRGGQIAVARGAVEFGQSVRSVAAAEGVVMLGMQSGYVRINMQ